jgi:magnesium-transporting ATPase (P-type)
MSYNKLTSTIDNNGNNNSHNDREDLIPVTRRNNFSLSYCYYFYRMIITTTSQLFNHNHHNNKPSSNPIGWPYSTEEDIANRPNRIIIIGGESNTIIDTTTTTANNNNSNNNISDVDNNEQQQIYSFCNNFVKTSKYEYYDFIPKFLIEEFNPKYKVANCYFLMIAILQIIPQISNTNGIPTTLLPLLFIILIDSVFQILEDIVRHKADNKANASNTLRYVGDKERGVVEGNSSSNDINTAHSSSPSSSYFIKCKWSDIKVGDYIKINSREMIPADIVIIAVAEKSSSIDHPPQGLCYAETKSLDGETNLKLKSALPCTLSRVMNILM